MSLTTSGWAFMISIRRERWGSSVISQRKSAGSWGGRGCGLPLSSVVGDAMTVRRKECLPSVRDSAPPK